MLTMLAVSAGGQTAPPSGGPPGGSTGGAPQPSNCYTVAYSGASCTFQPSVQSPTYTVGYIRTNGAYGYSYSTATKILCEGQITATFTWHGPDDPPKTVIVRETCVVGAIGYGGASYDNDLGTGSGQDSAHNAIPHYEIKTDPGLSFSVTRSPYARGYGAPYSNDAAAGLSYGASVSLVVLNVTGITRSGATNYSIIGRGAEGSISAGGFTLSNWSWTLPSNIFKRFSVSEDQNQGHAEPIDSEESSQERPHWFWKSPGSSTVQCSATATVGQQIVGTVTADVSISVLKPSSTLQTALVSAESKYLPGNEPIAWNESNTGKGSITVSFLARVAPPSELGSEGSGKGRLVQV